LEASFGNKADNSGNRTRERSTIMENLKMDSKMGKELSQKSLTSKEKESGKLERGRLGWVLKNYLLKNLSILFVLLFPKRLVLRIYSSSVPIVDIRIYFFFDRRSLWIKTKPLRRLMNITSIGSNIAPLGLINLNT